VSTFQERAIITLEPVARSGVKRGLPKSAWGVRGLPFVVVAVGVFALVSSPVIFRPDSRGYLLRGDTPFGEAYGSLSFFGDALRPWPTVLVFVAGPTIGVIAQYALYVTAVLLFCRVARRVSLPRAGTFALIASLALLLNRNSIQWLSIVHSEAVTAVLTIVTIAAVLLFLLPDGKPWLAVLAVSAAGLSVVNRPTQLPLFLVAAILVAVESGRRQRIRQTVSILILAGVALIYAVGVNAAISSHWAASESNFTAASGVERTSVGYFFLTATGIGDARDSRSDRLYEALVNDPSVPPCVTEARPVWEECVHCSIPRFADSCPIGVAWVNDDFQAWYARFLLQDPTYSLSLAADALWQSAQQEVRYADPWSPVPPLVEKVFTGVRFPVTIGTLGPAALIGAVVALARLRRPRVGSIRESRTLDIALLAVLAASLVSILLANFQMNMEVGRISQPGVLGTFLAVILIVSRVDVGERPEVSSDAALSDDPDAHRADGGLAR